MKEWQKEWLGIKPADFVIYTSVICLIGMYYTKNMLVDITLAVIGLLSCLVSIYLGIKPHPELNKITNLIKMLSYPLCTMLFIYFLYLNFTIW